MAYPPPPGLRPDAVSMKPSTSLAHASLPPRPPPSLKPTAGPGPSAFSQAPGTRGFGGPSASHLLAFEPRSVIAQSQPLRSHSPAVSVEPAPPSGFSAGFEAKQPSAHFPQPQPYGQPASFQEGLLKPTPPQISNPFPLPGQGGAARTFGQGQDVVDPELEAQIAQWQSAYAGKDVNSSGVSRTFSNKWAEGSASSTGANSAALGSRVDGHGAVPAAANVDSGVAEVVTGADGKQKTVVRQGGGQTWQDPSLLEWDPAHFRLFVGNLAGEVTDDSLLKAFAKYISVQKARVVRDKRTTKSKGYGFVSFADGDEYFQAARDMQGKYIGSHPVLLRKSTTEIRPTVPKNQKKGAKRGKGVNGSGSMGASSGHGVQKKQSKIKNGLKVLG